MGHIRKLQALELGYGLLGLGVTAWAIAHIPSAWYLETLGLLVGAAILSFFSIRLDDPVRLPGAMPIEMATLLLAPPPVSILLAAFTNLFTSLRFRRPPLRTLFNVANLAIPNALATLVLAAFIHPWPSALRVPVDLPVILLAILVRMVSNLLMTAIMLRFEGQISLYWPYVIKSLAEEGRSGGFGIRLIAVLMALAFPVAGWWSLVLGALLQMAIGRSMQRYQERIDRQTRLDGLTGLSNRQAWQQYLAGSQASAPHVLAVIDVNGLKQTNDTLGHLQGDAILVDLGRRLLELVSTLGQGARAFRVGGDEFVLILPGSANRDRFRIAVEQTCTLYTEHWGAMGISASASVGFASVPAEAPNIASGFRVADHRMYLVKPSSRVP